MSTAPASAAGLAGAGGGSGEIGARETGLEVNAVVVRRDGEAAGVEAADGGADLSFAAVGEAEALALALSPQQRVAIERLTSGRTAVEAASAAGVGRATLYRWLKDDPAFVAAYNAWQRDMVSTARGKLLAMTDLALGALGKALRRGDGWLALAVLRQMGISGESKAGETDVEVVKREQALAAREAELEWKKAETVVAGEEEQLNMALACGPMLAGMGLGAERKKGGKRGGRGMK